MSSKINWKSNSNRLAVFMILKNLNGGYSRDWKGRVFPDPQREVEILSRTSAAMALAGFENFDETKGNAIGMQHRWAVSEEQLSKSQDWKTQLKLIVLNRISAVQAEYLSQDVAIELLLINGVKEEAIPFFMLAVNGHLTAYQALDAIIAMGVPSETRPAVEVDSNTRVKMTGKAYCSSAVHNARWWTTIVLSIREQPDKTASVGDIIWSGVPAHFINYTIRNGWLQIA